MFGPGVSTMPNATNAKAKRLVSDGIDWSPNSNLSLNGPRLPRKAPLQRGCFTWKLGSVRVAVTVLIALVTQTFATRLSKFPLIAAAWRRVGKAQTPDPRACVRRRGPDESPGEARRPRRHRWRRRLSPSGRVAPRTPSGSTLETRASRRGAH